MGIDLKVSREWRDPALGGWHVRQDEHDGGLYRVYTGKGIESGFLMTREDLDILSVLLREVAARDWSKGGAS